jgi:hypothetical protein
VGGERQVLRRLEPFLEQRSIRCRGEEGKVVITFRLACFCLVEKLEEEEGAGVCKWLSGDDDDDDDDDDEYNNVRCDEGVRSAPGE